MFKNSQDERKFEKMLITYRQEFGQENLIVYMPQPFEPNGDIVWEPTAIKKWKYNRYAIKVRDMSATFSLEPSDV